MNKGLIILNLFIAIAAVFGLGYLIWRVDIDLLGIPEPIVQDMTESSAPQRQTPPPGIVPHETSAPIAPTATGSAVFTNHCATCHGVDGRGQTFVAATAGMPSVANLPELPDKSPDTIRRSVTNGKGAMPAFGTRLSPAELEAVLSHVHQLISSPMR